MTAFPTSLDSFTNPNASTPLNSSTAPHAGQHANANDAIEAIEAKVGVNGSTVTNSLDYLVKTATSPGHTHNGGVTLAPTQSQEVHSLGLGTPAKSTLGSIAIKSQGATTVASVTLTGHILYVEIGASGDLMRVRPQKGLTNGQVTIGFGVTVYNSGGTAHPVYIDTHVDTPGIRTTPAAVSAPAVTSGTAFTPNGTLDTTVYAHTGATTKITMGPTTGAEYTVCATAPAGLLTVRVPGGWKVVVTSTTITSVLVVTC